MKRVLLYLPQGAYKSKFHFKFNEDIGYWILGFSEHKATIPLVQVKPENDFYTRESSGWNITKQEWEEICNEAMTVKLLVDPFKRGEHMEDAV